MSHFIFLSIVSFKRADYLLPAFPPVALLLAAGCRIGRRGFIRIRPSRRLSTLGDVGESFFSRRCLALMMIPVLVWAGIEFQENGVVESLLKIDLLSDHLNETDRFMMSHVEQTMRESWPLLVIGSVVLM